MGANAVRKTLASMDDALDGAHLEVVFQPIYTLSSRSLVRYEALARWRHPSDGVVAPGAFLAAFEAQGRLGDLTRYMLDRTFEDAETALPDGRSGPGVSVNLSVTDLMDGTLPETIRAALDQSGWEASKLTLECPQAVPAITWRQQREALARLADSGCPLSFEARGRIAAVDEGLQPFPYTEIKTGAPALLRAIRSARASTGLTAVSDLITFARANGVTTVAVGIDDDDAAAALEGLGFDAGQGEGLGESHRLPTTPPRSFSAATHADIGSAPGARTDDARREAERRAAMRRFKSIEVIDPCAASASVPENEAETGARELQIQLETELSDGACDPTADPGAPPLINGEPDASPDGPAALLDELPAEPRAAVMLAEPVSVDWPMTDFLSPEDELDRMVATLSEAEPEDLDDTLGPARSIHEIIRSPRRARRSLAEDPFLLRVLRRKYRITHFWPRSFRRALSRHRARQANLDTTFDPVGATTQPNILSDSVAEAVENSALEEHTPERSAA